MNNISYCDKNDNLIQYLTQYFCGQLKCQNCGHSLPLDVSLVDDHVKSCINPGKPKTNKRSVSHIKNKFFQFVKSFDSCDEDIIPRCRDIGNLNKYHDFMMRVSSFRKADVLSFYNCVDCDITGSIIKWKNHLIKLHPSLCNNVHELNCIHCICSFCNTIIFGSREKVVQHCHFTTTKEVPNFSLFAYPHLNAVSELDRVLPKYYTFQHKLLVTDSETSQTAYYCLACDYYGLGKPRKHFQSNDHKLRIHPFFEFRFCRICNAFFYCDELLFEDHIYSPVHTLRCNGDVVTRSQLILKTEHDLLITNLYLHILRKLSDYQLYNQFQTICYLCEICSKSTTDLSEWTKHLSSNFHESNISKCDTEFIDHLCSVCKMHIFGDPEHHYAHSNSEGHMKIKHLVLSAFNCQRLSGDQSPNKDNEEIIDTFEKPSIFSGSVAVEVMFSENCKVNTSNLAVGSKNLVSFNPCIEKDQNLSMNKVSNDEDLGINQDELFNMLVKEECDAEKSVRSEDELDKTLADDVNSEEDTDEGKRKDHEKNEDHVEYAVIVRGIPRVLLRNKDLMKQTFNKYIQFDRSFTKKNEPGSLYLVVTEDYEESFKRMKQCAEELKQKWGIEELFIEYNATKNENIGGIREKLSEKAVMFFSNTVELKRGIIHMMRMYDYETNNQLSHRRISNLIGTVFKLANQIYSRFGVPIKPHIFGSRITGLAHEKSDVDIYLQIGPTFRGLIHQHVNLQQQLVLLFAKLMNRFPREFANVISIPFARVPIVKFTHLPSGLTCDVSFKSGLSTMNTYLVRTYLELDSRIKYLICALKMWMKLNDLADRNLFTTYAQIWMVLFFLMQPEIAVVPTVLALRHMLPPEMQTVLIENWNCSFPNVRLIEWKSGCLSTPEQLLYKFFEFYSNISLSSYVLCTLTGLKIEKKHFLIHYGNLPKIFHVFKLKIDDDNSLLGKLTSDFEGLCVQDPFDHCHNLTKNINLKKFTTFVELCKQTVAIFKLDCWNVIVD